MSNKFTHIILSEELKQKLDNIREYIKKETGKDLSYAKLINMFVEKYANEHKINQKELLKDYMLNASYEKFAEIQDILSSYSQPVAALCNLLYIILKEAILDPNLVSLTEEELISLIKKIREYKRDKVKSISDGEEEIDEEAKRVLDMV